MTIHRSLSRGVTYLDCDETDRTLAFKPRTREPVGYLEASDVAITFATIAEALAWLEGEEAPRVQVRKDHGEPIIELARREAPYNLGKGAAPVIELLNARNELGLRRYGDVLRRKTPIAALAYAIEEAADLVMYLCLFYAQMVDANDTDNDASTLLMDSFRILGRLLEARRG